MDKKMFELIMRGVFCLLRRFSDRPWEAEAQLQQDYADYMATSLKPRPTLDRLRKAAADALNAQSKLWDYVADGWDIINKGFPDTRTFPKDLFAEHEATATELADVLADIQQRGLD